MHSIDTVTGSVAICACGQGFSGAKSLARLTEHVASPDPTDTGALLIAVLS